jgi:hypothetical protein
LKRRPIAPSPTSGFTAMTPRSRSSKNPRLDCSVASEAKRACALEFVRAVPDRSDLDDQVFAKTVLAPTPRAARSLELREVNQNLDETAKKWPLVVNPKVRSRLLQELQKVH